MQEESQILNNLSAVRYVPMMTDRARARTHTEVTQHKKINTKYELFMSKLTKFKDQKLSENYR